MIATCAKCGKFAVPWDFAGSALMKQHQQSDCPGSNPEPSDEKNAEEET